MSNKTTSFYLTDHWTNDDHLNFGDFRPALEDILLEAQTPLTVGVYGAWGSGKTSLLRMLRKEIDDRKHPYIRTVWFTAWKYDRDDALWRAFMLRVLDALYPRESGDGARETRPRILNPTDEKQKNQIAMLGRLEASVYSPVDWQELGKLVVNWSDVAKKGVKSAGKAASILYPGATFITDLLAGEEDTALLTRKAQEYQRQQLVHLEQFEQTFTEAINLCLGQDGKDGRLIVFVDDLDRCLPEKAVQVLEAIKLFLGVPGTVFVLGMDREVIRRGIEARYGELFRQSVHTNTEMPIEGDVYLQKIIQIPFNLPPLAVKDLTQYIVDLEEKEGGARMSELTQQVFARGLYPNPRQVKRALNIFQLLRSIAERRIEREKLSPTSITDPLLAKTIVIQTQYPKLYQLWRQYPMLLQTLEEEYTRSPLSHNDRMLGQQRDHRILQQEEGIVEAVVTDSELNRQREERNRERSGGLLTEYLEQRSKYALLERMLIYPPVDEAEKAKEAGERCRFDGLDLDEMDAYIRLAGSVSDAEPIIEVDSDLLSTLLSGDKAKLDNGIAQIKQADNETFLDTWRTTLKTIMLGGEHSARERASAGQAVAQLGDLRDGVGARPDKLPDIAWGAVIPTGTYTIGDEKPYSVTITAPYQLAQYPITNAQFDCFTDADDVNGARWWDGLPEDEKKFSSARWPIANRPRETVSWYQAIAFCRWLTHHLQTNGVIKAGETITIPHENQWEVAARYVGDGQCDRRLYPWGDDEITAEHANYRDTELRQTSAVGLFPQGKQPAANLYDLSGNVWEWCLNKYNDLDVIDIDQSGDTRTLRGGSWFYYPHGCRAAYRHDLNPHSRYNFVGVRVVRVLPSHRVH